MYRSVLIRYKMIFKNDYGNDTVEYKNVGVVLDNGTSKSISFNCEAGTIEIIYNKDEIILNNGNSRLCFYYHKERCYDIYY